MAANSKIAWCDATWSPVTGCTKHSEGCAHCYAKPFTDRMGRFAKTNPAPGVQKYKAGFDRVVCHQGALADPLLDKGKGKRIFVCSMSDLFHKDVPSSFLQQVFQVMRDHPQHTFITCTKRAERLAEISDWPSHVWAGVTVENDRHLDRLKHLQSTGAVIKWVSLEPLLGPVDVPSWLDWVVVAGESGPGARTMKADWVRSIRDRAKANGQAFFFKQWGHHKANNPLGRGNDPAGKRIMGKKGAKGGMTLDGEIWMEWPVVRPQDVGDKIRQIINANSASEARQILTGILDEVLGTNDAFGRCCVLLDLGVPKKHVVQIYGSRAVEQAKRAHSTLAVVEVRLTSDGAKGVG